MDNKKKLLIGGGIAAAIIVIIVLLLLLGGDEAKKEKITTSAQSTSEATEENTTSKDVADNDTTDVIENESSAEKVEESSDEEKTSVTDEESSEEEVTTKTASDAGKETTSKKEDKTTKKNETTTKKQTSKETTTKKQTTIAKQTTTKQETTTQEQTTVKPKPKSGRIKECELALVNACVWFCPDGVNRGSIYTDLKDMVNPFIEERDVFGWENIAVVPILGIANYEKDDYFGVIYQNSELNQDIVRDINIRRKFNQSIIDDCDDWVSGTAKYSTAEDFEKYLKSRYSLHGSDSIFDNSKRLNPQGSVDDMYEGKKKEWCEKWCYYDSYLQKYRTEYELYYEFTVEFYEYTGYYTDVKALAERIEAENIYLMDADMCYVRWKYNANEDKTVIYIVSLGS